jgi:hypothetical protein
MIAQALAGYSLAQLAIGFLLIIGVVGIVVIVARNSGVPIPPWVYQIGGIVILVIVGIIAIKILMSV